MALTLSACGRRGDLEPPATASVVQNSNDARNLQRPPNPKITPPHQTFILDPLLK
jgi:hypothetical protein